MMCNMAIDAYTTRDIIFFKVQAGEVPDWSMNSFSSLRVSVSAMREDKTPAEPGHRTHINSNNINDHSEHIVSAA